MYFMFLCCESIFQTLHVLEYESLQIQEDLTYEESPVKILAQKAQLLFNKTIRMVKVL